MAEPLVNSNNIVEVQNAIALLRTQRQLLLYNQRLINNPTPEMKTWSPARLQSFIDRNEADLKNNTALISRGEQQLAILNGTSNVRQTTEQTTSNTAVDQAKLNSLQSRRRTTTVNDDGSFDRLERARLERLGKPTVELTSAQKSVGGGSTTAGDAQSSGTIQTPGSTNDPNTFVDKPGKRLKNPLGDFSSHNYLLSLYMVTPEAHSAFLSTNRTFLDTTSEGVYIVAQSGGLNKTNSKRVPLLDFDYYIDDLTLTNSLAGENNLSSATWDWKFNIIEPYGFSFISRLTRGYEVIRNNSKIANSATLDKTNVTKGFFILAIRFYGYDSNGELIIKNEVPFERYYDLFITSMKFNLDGRATVYRIEAVDYGQSVGYGTLNGQVNHPTKIKAKTVLDAFKGPNGLFTRLNENEKKLTQQKDSNGVPTKQFANVYDIVFKGDNGKYIEDSELIELDKLTTPMSISTNTIEVNESNSIKSLPDFVNKTLTVDGGTPILQAIESIIVRSKYIQNALKVHNKNAPEPGPNGEIQADKNPKKVPLRWIRVSCEATASNYDASIKDFAKKITFIVTTYDIPLNNNAFASSVSPYPGPFKRYDYWFTGKNSEIRKFEQNINNTYYISYVSNEISKNSSIPTSPDQKSGQSNQGTINNNLQSESSIITSLQDSAAWAQSRITILGDPDYLMQPYSGGTKYYGIDGYTINPNNSQVFIEVNFHEAVDYNYDNKDRVSKDDGLLNINTQIAFYMPSVNVPKEVKGLAFLVWKCNSSFSKGVFSQELFLSLWQFPSTDGQDNTYNTTETRQTESERKDESQNKTTTPSAQNVNGLVTDKQTPNTSNSNVPTVRQNQTQPQNSNSSSTKDDSQPDVNTRVKIAFGLQEGRESESLINRFRSRLGIPIGGVK